MVGPYEDNDKTAADPNKPRPAYDRMMTDIRGGKIDVVVVSMSDRLHREPRELEDFMRDARAAGMLRVRTDRRRNEYNLNDSRDRKDLRDEVNDAKYETDRASDRTKDAMLTRARQGLPTGGGRPFGYNDDKVTINKREAALIRKAAQHIRDGGSLRSVTRDWDQRGIRSARGNRFYDTQVKKILTSARMVGLREHQGEVIGKAVWPGILEEDTWKQMCADLNNPARRMPRASQDYPLRGVATCALCGEFLQASPRTAGRRYKCRKEGKGCGGVSINADQFEKYIYGLILPILDHPYLREAVQAEDKQTAERRRELVLANAEDESMRKQLSSDYYTARVIDRQTYLEQSQSLMEQIKSRDNQLTSLQSSTALSRFGSEDITLSSWDAMSAEDKRSIISSVVGLIEVDKATNLGSHNFDPDRVRFRRGNSVISSHRGQWKILHNGKPLPSAKIPPILRLVEAS